jgi:hypothetical protein
MRKILAITALSALAVGCMPAENETSEVQAMYEANCATVTTALENFQNETADYSMYNQESFWARPTRFNPTKGDSVTLDELKESNIEGWAMMDYELVSDLKFLSGVDAATNLMDGSVRYYGVWKVTRTATDSVEAKSCTIPLYSSFDFDAEGKILFQQNYGDFTAAFNSLN